MPAGALDVLVKPLVRLLLLDFDPAADFESSTFGSNW